MMMKTHLVIGIALALFLITSVNHQYIFFGVLLLSTLLPDIDISNSYLGSKWYSKPIQLFFKHRGFIHSLTFCLIISVIFAFFFPILALPFFAGYSLHLITDSLTVEGIRPFWPLKAEVKGSVKVGGKIEETIFAVFAILDVILLIKLFI